MSENEIRITESIRYATYDEAVLNANDLANDDLDADVIEIDGRFAVKVMREFFYGSIR